MENIYILKSAKFISGPHTIESLQKRGLKRHYKIWYEGMQDWQPVESFEELKPFLVDDSPQTFSAYAKTKLRGLKKILPFLGK